MPRTLLEVLKGCQGTVVKGDQLKGSPAGALCRIARSGHGAQVLGGMTAGGELTAYGSLALRVGAHGPESVILYGAHNFLVKWCGPPPLCDAGHDL